MKPSLVLIDPDELFFRQHPSRQAHIRNAIGDEQHGEFMSLGDHDRNRRRIIAWKVPANCKIRGFANRILTIPFLALADETIADEDHILLPMINEVMVGAAKRLGIAPGRVT